MKQRTRIEEGHGRQGAAFDVIGIGFGPANLSLAVCMKEPRRAAHTCREPVPGRKPAYEWHPDMPARRAEIQVPFFKDLVTMRNPRSHFSFPQLPAPARSPARLHQPADLFPTRREFNHYYWLGRRAARRSGALRPRGAGGAAGRGGRRSSCSRWWRGTAPTGQLEELLTRNW